MKGRLPGSTVTSAGGLMRDKHVIDGFRQRAPVHEQFAVKTQHMRGRSRALCAINVSALAQYVEKENGAFERVSPVVEKGASEGVLLEHDGLL